MNQAATVHSIDAIREFRSAVVEFLQEARAAMVDVDMEVRRSHDWLLEIQPSYWQAEIRRSNDAINDAKNELHRCRMRTLPGGGTPSCMEERKAVDQAQRRLAGAEEKLQLCREWARAEQHEVQEYEGRATQLANVLDGTIPKALAFLDHAIIHLESYVATGQAAGAAAMTVCLPETADGGEPLTPSPSPTRGEGSVDIGARAEPEGGV